MRWAGKYRSAGFHPKDEPWCSNPAPHIRSTPKPPSLNGGVDTTFAPKRTPDQYSGTECLGIAAMHKSNLVPVFTQEQAVDTATMRRSNT
jgi:hypothetical protein